MTTTKNSARRKTRTCRAAVVLLLTAGMTACNSTGKPAPAPSAGKDHAARLTGIRWEWTALTTPVEQIAIDAPERYTLEFTKDGALAGRADCNQLFGRYTLDGSRITLEGIGTTKMLCPPGGHFDRFLRDLGQVTIYSFLDGGDLILELPVDSGTLRFRAGE